MIGETISHYKIISKLGSGGMGEVYLADDTKLDRKVALKFLPLEYTSDEDINTRFKREARAAAKLNHPNIIIVYEIGEHDDDTYIAMEYVKGESLRDVIKEGQLSIDRVTGIASQICEGLNEAHKAGIVHRDIKPENILIDKSGRVKIVDFGLAMVKGASKLTKDATTIGTLKYMSPEQYKNEDIDNRTDIFSFGVILFEMLTGKLPFQGEYQAAIMYSVVNEQPKQIKSLRPDTPQNLEQIINKTLEKNPSDRYQNIQEVITELKKSPIITTKEPEKEKSIVVLPFINMSPDPEQEYFSDGLTEEIITDLSHIHDLLVISRSSAMTFKGTKKTIPEIIKQVNVRYVLEGSVRKAANNLRITAQLIDAATDTHLWAEKYSGTLDDVFDIQEKVSRSIVDALKVKLTQKESKQIAERPIDNIHAYECYLKARQEMWKWTEEGLDQAKHLIETGLNILGENELLFVAQGLIYTQYINFVISNDRSLLDQAEKCALSALKLNPESSHAYFLLGFIDIWRPNIKDGVINFKKSLKLDPNNSETLNMLAYQYAISGKSPKAEPLFRDAFKLDPLNPLIYGFMSAMHWYEGRFEAAIEYIRKHLQLDLGNPLVRVMYSYLLAYTNRLDDAYNNIDQLFKDVPLSPWAQLGVFLKHALQGINEEALESVTEELKSAMSDNNLYPLLMADCYSLIGEKDEAIDWVENATQWGFINYDYLNKHAPFLENIRCEERFKKLMERVKHEWENFEV